MDISVIIVNYNTKKLLQNCLESIFKFTKKIKFEVIVVDNASGDGSCQMVRQKFPQVQLLSNKNNLGFAKANNQGIKMAKSGNIFLLNSDTYFVENSLLKLVEKVNKLNNFGVIGPQILNTDGSIQQSVGFFPHLLQICLWSTFIDDLPFGIFLNPYHVDHDSFYAKDHSIDWVTGAALLTSKKVIKKAGVLDEKIFLYGEDVEWCYRIKQSGFENYFSPVTKLVHIQGGSSGQISTKAFIGEYQGLIFFYEKYKSKLALQILKLLLKMGALVRICIFYIAGKKNLANSYVKVFKVV